MKNGSIIVSIYVTAQTQCHLARVQAIKILTNERAWYPFCSSHFVWDGYSVFPVY